MLGALVLQQYVVYAKYYEMEGISPINLQLMLSDHCQLDGSYIGSGTYSKGTSPFPYETDSTNNFIGVMIGVSIALVALLIACYCYYQYRKGKMEDTDQSQKLVYSKPNTSREEQEFLNV